MKALALLISFLLLNNIYSQQFTANELEISIFQLYREKLFNNFDDTLYINLKNYSIDIDSLNQIVIDGDVYNLNFEKEKKPFFEFTQSQLSNDSTNFLNSFVINQRGGTEYDGYLTFEFFENRFYYISCFWYSKDIFPMLDKKPRRELSRCKDFWNHLF